MEIGNRWEGLFSDENMYRELKEFARKDGLPEMDRAIDYAREMHSGQFRKPDIFSDKLVPYIVHPYILACHAHALGIRSDTMLTVCLLHDVCEDCGITPEQLPFAGEVRDAVRLLTKVKPVDMDAYYQGISGNSTAAIVKVFDRCNNISTMMLSFSKQKIIEYVEETERYVLPLLDHIKMEYVQYYDVVFVLEYQILSVLESVKAAILRL